MGMNIPQLIDTICTIREDRLAIQKQAEELKQQEEELKETLLLTLGASFAPAYGKTMPYQALRRPYRNVIVTDWPSFYEHILTTKNLNYLEKRAREVTVREDWQEGKTVPGVTWEDVFIVKITKLKE